MDYVLGLDGGGSKTVCFLADKKGMIVGRGEAGSALYYGNGTKKALGEIKKAFNQAAAGCPQGCIQTACFGLAGIDSKTDYKRIYRILKAEEFAPGIVLENDAVIALVGGNAREQGVVLIAGTGAIAYGINKQGQRRRSSGWGHLIGDEGSGYNIAVSGVAAALRAYDGRGQDTLLVKLFKDVLALETMEDIMERIYFSLSKEEIASLAYLVFEAVEKGDQAAREIIHKAGSELALSIKAVLTALELTQEEIEIPLVGGVFKNQSAFLIETISQSVKTLAPKAKIVKPRFDPAIGAVILALSKSGIDISQEILNNLERTQAEYV
ncbi:MAG: ATPase [Firmicutes bacterium]|nr:ATPase [Bacillota bacterium]